MEILWKDSYSLGDPTVDREHQELFKLANETLLAHNKPTRTQCALKLYQHVRLHFEHEEKIMKDAGFPDLQVHIGWHDQLISQLNALSQSIAQDRWNQQDLQAFMAEWTGQHIGQADVALATYLKNRAPEPV